MKTTKVEVGMLDDSRLRRLPRSQFETWAQKNTTPEDLLVLKASSRFLRVSPTEV